MTTLPNAPETIELTTRYSRGTAALMWGRYDNGRIALQFADAETGEPLTTATVNVPEFTALGPEQALIKTWAENEGLLAELIRHELIEDTHGRVRCGFAQAAVVRWKVRIPELA